MKSLSHPLDFTSNPLEKGGTCYMFGKGEVFWGNVAADWMEVQFVLFTVVEKTWNPQIWPIKQIKNGKYWNLSFNQWGHAYSCTAETMHWSYLPSVYSPLLKLFDALPKGRANTWLRVRSLTWEQCQQCPLWHHIDMSCRCFVLSGTGRRKGWVWMTLYTALLKAQRGV